MITEGETMPHTPLDADETLDAARRFRDQLETRGVGAVVAGVFAEFRRAISEQLLGATANATVALDAELTGGLFGTTVTAALSERTGRRRVSGHAHRIPGTPDCEAIHLAVTDAERTTLITIGTDDPGLRLTPVETGGLAEFPLMDAVFDNCGYTEGPAFEANRRPEWLTALIDHTRLVLCGVALDCVDRMVRETLDHSVRRPMGGARLIDQQAVRHRLGDIAGRRQVLDTVARRRPGPVSAAHLALLTTALLPEAMNDCAQFHGGRGILWQYPIAAHYHRALGLTALIGRRDLLVRQIVSERYAEPDSTCDPELEQFRAYVRGFVDTEIAPDHREWEDDGELPRSVFEGLARAGLTGIMIPAEFGGAGATLRHTQVLTEEFLRYPTMSVLTSLAVQSHTVLPLLAKLGTPEQRTRYLTPSLAGELISGIAITDPAGGSDLVRSVQLTARRDGDDWILDGEKLLITNSPIADFLVVLARTDPARGPLGMTLFVVDTTTPGFEVAATLDKAALRSSPTGWLRFTDCRVPDAAVLGAVGDGYRQVSAMLAQERLLAAACSAAIARQCLSTAWRLHGNRLSAVPDSAAEDLAQTAVVSAFVSDLVARHRTGDLDDGEVALAKYTAPDLAQRVIRHCAALTDGGAFPDDDYLTASHADIRVPALGAGSSETMREMYTARLLVGRGLRTPHPTPEFDAGPQHRRN
ncbi:acyl-CoA dehydrogenase family protein [Nocardia huaxiensis]|uniref:acyl-CoA dehydrogenase family protein n=1 Tax=Nocardia huaxiensis TaxID=2755382 RepID=UPI001E602CF5|nr:acyl-CoA dehydrogenase family protein [Nocardia huaxiensis]UFS98285.1 acyl-CoA dehydrogenase family protein [Nocardia huaxiensis]